MSIFFSYAASRGQKFSDPPPISINFEKVDPPPLYEGWEVPTMLLHLIEQGNVKLAKPITLTP